MKLLLAAVAAAVLLLTAGTIWMGASTREDTVVAHPYEQGLAHPPAACDLGAGACTRALGDLELTLEVAPRPLRPMAGLALEGRLSRQGVPVDGAEVAISFAMRGMEMGENASRLAGAGDGRYRGEAVLVRCPSGRRDWIATAVVRHGGREHRAAFDLRLGE